MSAVPGAAAGGAAVSYHSITGYSNTDAGVSGPGHTANPLAPQRLSAVYPTENRDHHGSPSRDPFVAQQQQQMLLLRNPSARLQRDGSITYDPDYNPKHHGILSMAPYDDREDDFEPVEPMFWIVFALVVGLGGFVAFMTVAGLDLEFPTTTLGFMRGRPVYIAAGGSAGLLFALFALYYGATSQDPARLHLGHLIDGVVGGLPYLFLGGAVGYLVSGLTLMIVELVNDQQRSISLTWWFVTFASVPLFLLLLIPMFVVAMQVQEAAALNARLVAGIPTPPAGYIPRTNHGVFYVVRTLRRFLVGFVMACGLAAFYTIPGFALGWVAWGLYRSTTVYYWLPLVIVLPTVVVLLVVGVALGCVAPHLLRLLATPLTAPLTDGWQRVALRSSYFPRYINGLTIQHMVDEANDLTRRANRLHLRGRDPVAAQALYDEAERRRADIEERGVELRERACKSWRRKSMMRSVVPRQSVARKTA